MKKSNILFGIKLLLFGSVILFTMSFLGIQVQAETVSSQIRPQQKVTFEPPGGNQPKSSKGGASRGNFCSAGVNDSSPNMVSLIPDFNQGLTLKSHPTLMVYIPNSVTQVFLSIQEIDSQTNYQKMLPIKGESGIVSITLPQEAPGLEIGKNYQWSVVAMCNNQLRPDSPLVQGLIKRIEPTAQLKEQLNQATPLESAILYGQAGIWYETITALAQLKLKNPGDRQITANWEELLTSVGLGEIAKVNTIN
jgi:hypothetical protein